ASGAASMSSALFLRERWFRACLILGKQNLTSAAVPAWRKRGICFRFFPVALLPAPGHFEHRAGMIVVKAQVEVVKVGDRRGNAQPKTAAGNAMAARGPVKPLEYLVPLRRVDADSVVAHADHGLA